MKWPNIDWDRFADAYQDPWNAFVMSAIMLLCFVCMWYSRYPNLSPTFWAPRGGWAHRTLASAFAFCWGLQIIVQAIGLEAITHQASSASDLATLGAQYSVSTVAAKTIFLVNMTQIIWVFWIVAHNNLVRAAFRQVLDPKRAGNVIVMFTDEQEKRVA